MWVHGELPREPQSRIQPRKEKEAEKSRTPGSAHCWGPLATTGADLRTGVMAQHMDFKGVCSVVCI